MIDHLIFLLKLVESFQNFLAFIALLFKFGIGKENRMGLFFCKCSRNTPDSASEVITIGTLYIDLSK